MTSELPPDGAGPLPPLPVADADAAQPVLHEAQLDADGWRRLHPLSPLLRGGLVFLVVAGIVVANLRDKLIELVVADQFDSGGTDFIDFLTKNGLVLVGILVVVGVIALIVLFSWLSWRFHSFRITPEAVESRSGILFRQHRRAPLERIQSVNLQRPLLARMLGLTQLEVQTGGQGGKVTLNYLGFRDAQGVREQILRSAAASRAGAVAPTTGAIAPAAGTVASAADTVEPVAGAGAAAHPGAAPGSAPTVGSGAERLMGQLDRRVQDFADFDVDQEAVFSGTLVTVPPGRLIASILLGWEFVTVALLAVASVVAAVWWQPVALSALVPLAIATIGICFRLFNRGWGFTLSRGADAVRVGAGLTATRTETIPLGRVHAVEARQPLIWRLFGWWQVRVTTAGHSAADGGQSGIANIVLPVGLEADVLRVIETLLPGTGDEAELHDALAGPGTGFLPAGRHAGWVLWFARRRTGLRLVGTQTGIGQAGSADPGGVPGEATALRIRRGALTRSLSIIPILRVQSVQYRLPLVHRALGLASIQVHTVLGPVHTEMRGVDRASAREAFDALSAIVVAVQSAEARRIADGRAGSGA